MSKSLRRYAAVAEARARGTRRGASPSDIGSGSKSWSYSRCSLLSPMGVVRDAMAALGGCRCACALRSGGRKRSPGTKGRSRQRGWLLQAMQKVIDSCQYKLRYDDSGEPYIRPAGLCGGRQCSNCAFDFRQLMQQTVLNCQHNDIYTTWNLTY